MRGWLYVGAFLVGCGGGGTGGNRSNPTDGGTVGGGGDGGGGASLGSCSIFPADFIFNTPINALPADTANSDTWVGTIGNATKLHLDLGTETDQSKADYYGIPSNVVSGNSLTWSTTKFNSSDDGDESDCADASHNIVSPCNVTPILPIPTSPLVEGGLTGDNDHHMLVVDADNCRLWELYDAQKPNSWTHDNSSTWDLTSDALRPDTWTSADAAGFPIYPLLLRASEASSGTINHAMRFTAENADIRGTHVWPARHDANPDNTSSSQPQMGQLFRLKSSYQIPSNFNTQSKAILTAMQTYGMYLSDNGSSWYVQGEPSADWQDDTFDQVQSVAGSNFEAVDITAITGRSGFDPNSGKVPPP